MSQVYRNTELTRLPKYVDYLTHFAARRHHPPNHHEQAEFGLVPDDELRSGKMFRQGGRYFLRSYPPMDLVDPTSQKIVETMTATRRPSRERR